MSAREAATAGELKRLRDTIERLRAHVDAIEDEAGIGIYTTSTRQALTTTAVQVSNHAAAIDALRFLGEREQ